MTFAPQYGFEPPLEENVTFSTDWKLFLDQITRYYRDAARKINEKERAYYPLDQEILNDQRFYTAGNPQKFRSVFRKVFTINPAVLNFPHYINGIVQITRLYGIISTNIPDDRPLPFIDPVLLTNSATVLRNAANIVIINGGTAPAITGGFVIIEYLKQV